MTTTAATSTVALFQAVDFLIFTNVDIFLSNKDFNVDLKGLFIDREENIATIKIENDQVFPENATTLTVTCTYKLKKLIFDISIQSANKNTRILICEIPKNGYLFDQRNIRRSSFSANHNVLNARITAETVNGAKNFHAYIFNDFSVNTISVRLNRNEGLLLPGDTITNIDINNNQSLVFNGSGKVLRIHDFDHNSFMAIIGLDDFNDRPNIDIHNNERRSGRVLLINLNEGFIEFNHPFSLKKIWAKIVDLSNAGLSIIQPDDQFPMIPGMIIGNASMQLPLRPRLDLTMKVRGVTNVTNDDITTYRVSLEFVKPSLFLTKEVTAFVQQSISSNLYDARPEDDRDLLEFYFETGFIYENKRRQIQHYNKEVVQTLMLLLQSDTPLLKKIVYKEKGKILGSGTAIKIYDNTLMLQHLNAIKTHSGTAARAIIKGMTTYFLDRYVNIDNDNRYVCTYYRPDNLFPSLVFGETTNLINNPNICWKQDYQFCTKGNSLAIVEDNQHDIIASEAIEADKFALEQLLIKQCRFNLMRTEGLYSETLTNMHVFDEYKKIGLYRGRRIFVSKNITTGDICYGICAYASPGMNLSELTNSVKFYSNSTDKSIQLALMNKLMPVIIESYNQTAMKDPVLLIDEDMPIPNGFKPDKVYTMWVMDLYHPQLFKDYTDMIFDQLKEFIRKKKVTQ